LALLLHERAMETGSEELVRLTLLEGGAAPRLVDALIPKRPLEPGEQYRFHFDMTKCIGCRSCEVACNEQNGNPTDIKWRRLGELEGGTYPQTHRSYLSMGCNHCLSADCLHGCPVDAYTKDPVTGIVLHSAEACIGCQYCVWNCPYSVPQFNPERGVVGKCDMCQGRLLDGLEPACVNACPENAIQIEIVNKEEWRKNYAAAESPGMPPAGQTISTTRITLPHDPSSWLERVDTGSIQPEHAHPSLIVMTTAMQAVFGTLAVLWLSDALDTISLTLLFALTAVALNISVFHLGRPAYAWRALKMWRRSWLSREVLCFGLLFGATAMCVAASWAASLGIHPAAAFVGPLATAAVLFGLCGTVASACIYFVRARPAWNTVHTPIDFLLSAGLIGNAMAAAMQTPGAALAGLAARHGLPIHIAHLKSHALPQAILAAAWCANQGIRAFRLWRSENFESRASFNLLRSENMSWKFIISIFCAVVSIITFAGGVPSLAVFASLATVLFGRYLFFVTVVPLSMALTFLKGKSAHGRAA